MLQNLSRTHEAFIEHWLVFDQDKFIYNSQLEEAYRLWLDVDHVPEADRDELIKKIVQRDALRGLYGYTDIKCIYGVALRQN